MLAWLFGSKPEPIDATAAFRIALNDAIRAAVDAGVQDSTIDALLKASTGYRRGRMDYRDSTDLAAIIRRPVTVE